MEKKNVNIYLNQIVSAVTKYAWNRVFNMDETCVHINSSSIKKVAPPWTEQVAVDKEKNEKSVSQ